MEIKPILFTTPMVQAILDGRKTQTRRTTNLKLINEDPNNFSLNGLGIDSHSASFNRILKHSRPFEIIMNPYGYLGSVIWVRETFAYTGSEINTQPGYVYKASDPDWSNIEGFKWKPSIHMPKEAARLFLKVTDVRIERLHEISEEDALAEGLEKHPNDASGVHYKNYQFPNHFIKTPEFAFESLWSHINEQKSWNKNPWVWVIEFERVEKPFNF